MKNRNILKKLLIISFCLLYFTAFSNSGTVGANKGKTNTVSGKEEGKPLKIIVKANGKTVTFELNESTAAKSLYDQLPMTVDVENYSNNEKIFYPEKKLDTSDAPLANAKKGTLAYYAHWGDIVMFYADFGSASGLYELGEAVSGNDEIVSLSGKIQIEKGN